jgi:hypothetical protein
MQILQLLGILVILNTLTCAGWFVLQGKQMSTAIMGLVAVSVISGLVLTVRGRTEKTGSGDTTRIRLVETQAATDARQIAMLKEQVQTQATALDSMAKEAAETRRLLDSLSQANQKAEEKLKRLSENTPALTASEKTSAHGFSERLEETRGRMMHYYEQKDYEATYQAAKSCIQLFENGSSGSADQINGDLTSDDIAVLYGIGAEMAIRMTDNHQAVEWAQKGVSASPSAEGKFTLVAALCGAEKNGEARKLVDETLSHQGPEADKFKALLRESGLMKVPN